MRYSANGYLPGYPDDYSQVTSEEMADFLVKILEESDYTTIVLDMGTFDRRVLPVPVAGAGAVL